MRILPQFERDFPSFLKDLLAALSFRLPRPRSPAVPWDFFLMEPGLNNLLKALKQPWVRKPRKLDTERYVSRVKESSSIDLSRPFSHLESGSAGGPVILHASAAAPAATEELIVVKAQQATRARSLLWPRSGEKIGRKKKRGSRLSR